MRLATILELGIYDNTFPLVGGYLSAYAKKDVTVADNHVFRLLTYGVDRDEDDVVEDLFKERADIYGLSCYSWNMRTMRRMVERIRAAQPDAWIVLGGPQVMDHASHYLPTGDERMVVVNREGEISFQAFLRETMDESGDLERVPGITYWKNGALVTTEAVDRIKDLNEIPSPYQTWVDDGRRFAIAIIETNRGCPFRCSFCFWGAATNDRVRKMTLDRIKADIDWIAEHHFLELHVADANFGMVPHDIDIAKHVVACRKEHGYPRMISYSTAKNRPDASRTITELLTEGGVTTTQPISMQTMDPVALEAVSRRNIKLDAYEQLQDDLTDRQISSYIQLIWPLPRETLDSFKSNIQTLCRRNADTIVTYPLQLIKNSPMEKQVDEFGLVTETIPHEKAEIEIVVATDDVSPEDYSGGLWYFQAVQCAYNFRGAYILASYLDRNGYKSFRSFFEELSDFLRDHCQDSFVAQYIANTLETYGHFDILYFGRIGHFALHSERNDVEQIIHRFGEANDWWGAPFSREAYMLDLVLKPYVYREQPRDIDFELPTMRVRRGDGATYVVGPVAEPLVEILVDKKLLDASALDQPRHLIVDHRGRPGALRLPYLSGRSLDHNAMYTDGMCARMRDINPLLSVTEEPAVHAVR